MTSIKNPPDLRRTRHVFTRAASEIREIRRRYLHFCFRRILQVDDVDGRSVLIVAVGKKMVARGLYARSTKQNKVRQSILRAFYLMRSGKERRYKPRRKGRRGVYFWILEMACIGFDAGLLIYSLEGSVKNEIIQAGFIWPE